MEGRKEKGGLYGDVSRTQVTVSLIFGNSHYCPPQPLRSCVLDRRFALCYLITSF